LRLWRHPDLVLSWTSAGARIRNISTGVALEGEGLVEVLNLFDRPLSPSAAVKRASGREPKSTLATIRMLRRHGFLVPETRLRDRRSRADLWKGNLAAAQYHAACRGVRYLEKPAEI